MAVVTPAKVESVEVMKKEQQPTENVVEIKSSTASSKAESSEEDTEAFKSAVVETTPAAENDPGTPDKAATTSESEEGSTIQEGTSEDDKTPTTPAAPAQVEQQPATGDSATVTSGGDLTLYMNSNKMEQDGKSYLAGQPMTVKNGVSYVAIRALVDRVGYGVKYDNKTKETIIISGDNELRFKTNSKIYTVNGESRTMKGPAYQQKYVYGAVNFHYSSA